MRKWSPRPGRGPGPGNDANADRNERRAAHVTEELDHTGASSTKMRDFGSKLPRLSTARHLHALRRLTLFAEVRPNREGRKRHRGILRKQRILEQQSYVSLPIGRVRLVDIAPG